MRRNWSETPAKDRERIYALLMGFSVGGDEVGEAGEDALSALRWLAGDQVESDAFEETRRAVIEHAPAMMDAAKGSGEAVRQALRRHTPPNAWRSLAAMTAAFVRFAIAEDDIDEAIKSLQSHIADLGRTLAFIRTTALRKGPTEEALRAAIDAATRALTAAQRHPGSP